MNFQYNNRNFFTEKLKKKDIFADPDSIDVFKQFFQKIQKFELPVKNQDFEIGDFFRENDLVTKQNEINKQS